MVLCCAAPALGRVCSGEASPPTQRVRVERGVGHTPVGSGAFCSPGARCGVHCPPPPPVRRGAGSGIATWGTAPDMAERQRAELACPQGWGCSAAAHPAREVRLYPELLTPKIGRGVSEGLRLLPERCLCEPEAEDG